jgi:RNA polymerase sigma-70 factor (ECF subfamily)
VARARAEQLFSAHRRKVERICRALLRDGHEAEDAAQQTFLSAFRALQGGAEPREPEAWLGTIARNECLARIRARMRAPLPALERELEDGQADVHRQAVSQLNAARLWQEIQSLPAQQRDAVVLREFAGLSYDELAVALGVSDAAIESLLFRARGTLRRRLEPVLASLDFAGVAAGIAGAAARLLAGGVAPVATKAAAVGVGAAVVGSGALFGERALTQPTLSATRPAIARHAPAPVAVTHAIPVAASPTVVHATRLPTSHVSRRPIAVTSGDEQSQVRHAESKSNQDDSGDTQRMLASSRGDDNGDSGDSSDGEHGSATTNHRRHGADGSSDENDHGGQGSEGVASPSGKDGTPPPPAATTAPAPTSPPAAVTTTTTTPTTTEPTAPEPPVVTAPPPAVP